MSCTNSTAPNAPPPRRRGWSALARFGATLTVLLAAATLLLAQPGADEEPLSIQRLLLPPARLAKELEKVQQGTLILMPLEEFDARVAKARQAQKARADRPRLTRTHYTAELVDRALANGSGQWTVQYGGSAPAILPIDPLNLAMSRPTWEQGGEAILAELDLKTLGLLVQPGNNATCLFDWSARGTPTSDGLVFNLLVPPCPITTFEFKIPADYWLTTPKNGTIVTGPHDAGSAGLRLWKLQITGSTELEINLRKVAEPKGPAPTIFARVQSVQQLAADRVLIEHEFQLDVLHGSVRELTLHGDTSLEPYDVSLKAGGDLKSWQWKEIPAKKDAKGKELGGPIGALTIQFRQPVLGKVQGLRVRSLAARPVGPMWSSPALRVDGALSRGELLTVHLSPDFPLGKWSSGSFQLTGLLTESDGTQVLPLADTASTPAASRRPTMVFPPKGIDLAASEQYHWHIAPRRAELDAEIQLTCARGELLEIPIKLPAGSGYQVETLELSPAALLRGWQANGDSLVVEFTQPLSPGKKASLKLQLRAALRAPIAASRDLAFPTPQLLDGAKREGTLTVTVDPTLQGQMLDASAPLLEAAGADSGMPSWRLTFRGPRCKALMRVAPAPLQVQFRGKHVVALAEQDAALQIRWEAEPLAGAPEFLDFLAAPGFPARWKIKTEEGSLRIHRWERLNLPRAGPTQAVAGVLLDSAHSRGTVWRFHLAQPLRHKGQFTLQADLPPGMTEAQRRRLSLAMPSEQPWELLAGALAKDLFPPASGAKIWSIPLMSPLQGSIIEHQMRVDPGLEPIDKIDAQGALVARSTPGIGKSSWQVELQQKAGPASLLIWTRPENRAASPSERCDEASITTSVRRDGSVWRRICFRLWHWRDRTFELPFPAGSAVVAARLNDRWLERQDLRLNQDACILKLPFDQNVDFVRYEIYVRSAAIEMMPGLVRIETPTVAFPVAPLDLQCRACLENGWLPLDREGMSPVGVPATIAAQSAALRWPGRLWNLAQAWLPFGGQSDLLDQLARQKSALLLAEKQLRDAGDGKAIRLGDALELLAFKHLKDAAPLVIDRVALGSLGLTPESMIAAAAMSPQARPFWESVGLVCQPCPSGVLLTSPRRLKSLGIDSPAQTSDLDPAIKEAILHGHDSSGGFLLIQTWLRLPPAETTAFFSDLPTATAADGGAYPDMTEWDFPSDGGPLSGFLVFDPQVARILSVAAALLAALGLWKVQRAAAPIVAFRAHVLLVTGGILAMLWWPATVREFFVLPVLAVCLVSFFVCLVRLLRVKGPDAHTGGSTIIKPAAKGATLAVLLLGLTWGAAAQPTPSRAFAVFLIEGKKPSVLVPPELTAKLQEWEKQSAGPQGVVLTRARYSGTVKDGLAKFDVEYQVHCTREANLVIPLTGIQLQEGAFLDGVPVYPAPHKSGYALPIKAVGMHQVRLSFAVRVVSTGEHFDLKFTMPKLVQTAVQVEWPTPVQGLHCQHCWGQEKRTVDVRQAVKEWRGEVGGENVLHLRWTNSGTQPAPKTIEVKEAHFWDLRPASTALTSVLQYFVGAGTLTQLTVSLPEGLYVRGVEAASLQPASAAPLSIKNWHVLGKGPQRRLNIEFAQPSTGTIALHLDIVPQFPQRERKLLPLPAPLQGKSVAGLLGYRLDADGNPSAQDLAVQNITPEEFEPLWKKAGGAPVAAASRAYRFQRKSPLAGLEVDLRGDARRAQFSLRWGLDLHHADLSAKFTLRSTYDDLMLLEFFVDPTLTVSDVAGPDVKRWHLQDSLLQVWLRQPRKEAAIEIAGWRSLPFKNDPALKRTLVLPRIHPLGAQITQADLELRPAAGIHVEQELVRKLRPPFEAAVNFRWEKKPPEAVTLTKVQATQQGVELWHSIFLTTEQGRLPGLKIQVKDWHGAAPIIDAPGAVVRPIADKQRKHPAWTLQYPSGLPQKAVVTLRGRIDKDQQGRVGLPEFELDGARISHSWVAWKDVELSSAGKKLANQRGVKEKIAALSSAAWLDESPGWHSAQAGPSLQAALPKTAPRSTIRVLTATETIRRFDGHWLHQASFWIQAAEAAELRIRFPADIEAFSALTDQHLQTAWSPSAREFVLPLDAGAEPRLVELSWHDVGAAPNLTAIQMDQAVLPSQPRMLFVPVGMSAAKEPTPTLFEGLLQEANAQMQIAAVLAETPGPAAAKQIAPRQQQFFACVRQAEYALLSAKNVQHDLDAGGAQERIGELKRKNLEFARERRYDEQRANAEKAKKISWAALAGSEAEPGTPLLLSPTVSNLTLESNRTRVAAEARTRSELILLAAVFLLVFSYVRHSVSLVRRFAPEIGIAASGAWMLAGGVNPIGLALIGFLLLVRLFRIAKALWSRSSLQPESALKPPT